jgi:hypothetical protein
MSIDKMVNIAIESLKNQGFENIKAINPNTSEIHASKLISVKDLDGASNFTIVPLDATATQEFKDFIYVAIEAGTNSLLEAASMSKTPSIYNDKKMESILEEKYPGESFEIISGDFWKSELGGFLSIVRCFKIGNKEMFLLPNRDTTDNLDEYIKRQNPMSKPKPIKASRSKKIEDSQFKGLEDYVYPEDLPEGYQWAYNSPLGKYMPIAITIDPNKADT